MDIVDLVGLEARRGEPGLDLPVEEGEGAEELAPEPERTRRRGARPRASRHVGGGPYDAS